MTVILWIVLALLAAMLVVYISALRTRRLVPALDLPPGEKVPLTRVQRLVGGSLAFVVAVTAVAAGLVAYNGPAVWWSSDAVRLSVTMLLLAGLLGYGASLWLIRRWRLRDDGTVDERDAAIVDPRSTSAGAVMLVVLAVWMMALTETYRETRLVPSLFLYLVFWSCIMANVLASLAGILFGYRTR